MKKWKNKFRVIQTYNNDRFSTAFTWKWTTRTYNFCKCTLSIWLFFDSKKLNPKLARVSLVCPHPFSSSQGRTDVHQQPIIDPNTSFEPVLLYFHVNVEKKSQLKAIIEKKKKNVKWPKCSKVPMSIGARRRRVYAMPSTRRYRISQLHLLQLSPVITTNTNNISSPTTSLVGEDTGGRNFPPNWPIPIQHRRYECADGRHTHASANLRSSTRSCRRRFQCSSLSRQRRPYYRRRQSWSTTQ